MNNEPHPENGGLNCIDSNKEQKKCTGGSCKVNGAWGDWESWSSCGSNCKRSRSRCCNNPAPSNGGSDCIGENKEDKYCSEGRCREGTDTKYVKFTFLCL